MMLPFPALCLLLPIAQCSPHSQGRGRTSRSVLFHCFLWIKMLTVQRFSQGKCSDKMHYGLSIM